MKRPSRPVLYNLRSCLETRIQPSSPSCAGTLKILRNMFICSSTKLSMSSLFSKFPSNFKQDCVMIFRTFSPISDEADSAWQTYHNSQKKYVSAAEHVDHGYTIICLSLKVSSPNHSSAIVPAESVIQSKLYFVTPVATNVHQLRT